MLLEQWKFDGFLRYVKQVTQFYKSKRDITISAAEKYLKGPNFLKRLLIFYSYRDRISIVTPKIA